MIWFQTLTKVSSKSGSQSDVILNRLTNLQTVKKCIKCWKMHSQKCPNKAFLLCKYKCVDMNTCFVFIELISYNILYIINIYIICICYYFGVHSTKRQKALKQPLWIKIYIVFIFFVCRLPTRHFNTLLRAMLV